MTLIADVFLKLQTPKNVVREMSKSPVSENPLKSNMVNGLIRCSQLNGSTFTIFIDSHENNTGWKTLSELS